MKHATRTQGALDPDPATVKLDDVLHDGEAQAGSTRVAGAPLVDPIETLEDVRYIRFGDTGTRVTYADLNRIGQRTQAHVDAGSTRGVLEGVIQKISEDLRDAEWIRRDIAPQSSPTLLVEREWMTRLLGARAVIVDHTADERGDIRGFALEPRRHGLET